MSARTFDLHRAERRATQVAFVLGLWVVQHGVLGWFWVGEKRDDLRYAVAQRRGERLAHRMYRDGTLRARSPQKVIHIGGAR